MNRQAKSFEKISDLLKNHEKYDFPHFITELRQSLCISRKVMAQDLNIPYLKIFYLESGNFKKSLNCELMKKLSEYFGIELMILINKSHEWIAGAPKKNKKSTISQDELCAKP